ncbi:MAG TPA: hypothetical protein VFY32_08890 [Solirubrobacteraceae bacterium]|nr:hypothetical protein [Solirubrobacteraceae bacterium]
MHGRLVAGLAAAALLAAAPAGAVVPGGNLLVNPGAEAGAGAPDAAQQLPLPGWTVESTFTAVQYGAPGFLTAADSTALGGGVNFFAGGPGGALSAATQVIDMSGAATEIDAGKVTATLSALLGGYATQTDNATVSATFLNAGGAPVGAIRLVTVNPGDRNSVTALVARSSSAPVPAGTRQISVRIDAVRNEGSYNDGYIDNVSLVLGNGGPPVFHKSVGVRLVSGRVGIRRPGSKQDVDLKGSDVIPLGSTIDAEHGALMLSSVPRAGAAPQTAKFYEGVFKVTQTGGITQLTLAQSLASCRAKSRSASTAAKKKPSKRHLWGDGKGAFRTSGKYSSATVRGTKWLVQDSCAGTLTRVVRGNVTVRDNVKHKTVTVHAGQSYLAKPRR